MLLKKITNYEANSVIYLISRPLFLGLGITRIITKVGADVWISIILGTLIGLIINYILLKLPKNNFIIVKVLNNLLLMYLSIALLIKLIASIYLGLTPTIILVLPFVILLYYTAIQGETCFYKTSSILLFINFFVYLTAIITLFPTVKIDNFLPIGTTPLKDIITGAIDYAIISTIPYNTIDDFKERYNYKMYLLSSLSLFILFIIITGSLGVNLAKLYRYPEYIIFKKISLLSFIENIENTIFCAWIFDTYVISAKAAINIKKETKTIGLIFALLIILIACFFLLDNIKATGFLILNYSYLLGALLIINVICKIIKKKTNH
jgi:hypothetical protein